MPLELLTQRSDACPNQAAGHNVFKPREVCRTVQSLAVGRDVPSTADSCKTSQTVLEWIPSLPRLQGLPQCAEGTGLNH